MTSRAGVGGAPERLRRRCAAVRAGGILAAVLLLAPPGAAALEVAGAMAAPAPRAETGEAADKKAADKKAAEGAGTAGTGGGRVESDPIRIFDADEKVEEPAEREERPRRSVLGTLARTGFWLGLVVAMLCGLVALARKFLPKSMGMFRSPAMELLGRSYLDPKRCVYLLKIGGRMLVVGSAENGLSCLGEIAEREEVEYLAALARNGAGRPKEGRGGFAASMGRRVSRMVEIVRGGGEQVEPGCAELDLDPRFEEDGRADPVPGGAPAEPADRESGDALGQLKEKVESLKARLQTIS